MTPLRLCLPAALLLAVPVLAACTENVDPEEGDPRAIAVKSTDDACDLSAEEAPAGTLRLRRDQLRLGRDRVLPAR